MSKSNQIKTHFDGKVIVFFTIIFIVSCGLLAFKVNSKKVCNVKEFKIEAPSFKAGELITFSDKTPNSYEWRWYFGDGTKISYRSKEVHSFAKPGKYTVKLLVDNSCTIEKTITILPKNDVIDKALLPKIFVPKIVYQGDPVQFRDSTAHAKSWEWRFGDGMKITGFPTIHNSETEDAPAREITISAAAYTKSIRSTNAITLTFPELYFLYSSK